MVKTVKSQEFELFYNCRNNGDGSVSVDLHENETIANEVEENMYEGWGESSVSSIKLKLKGKKLFYSQYKDIDGKFEKVWIEVKPKTT